MEKHIIAIDYGGTTTKVVLFNSKGKKISSASFSTTKINEELGYAEIDMNAMWHALVEAMRKAVTKAKINIDTVAAITIVGHGKGLYLWGENGPLRNGILSVDNRAETLLSQLNKNNELKSYIACQMPVLLRWVKEHEKDVYDRVEHAFSAKDAIQYQLTGNAYGDYTDASSNGMMNLENNSYNTAVFESFGIEEMIAKMPQLISSDAITGGLSESAANQSGLKAGTPVVMGCFDVDACALAANVITNKYLSMTAGTWSVNVYPSETIKTGDDLLISKFLDGKQYLIESSSPTSAGNLNYMLKLIYPDVLEREEDIYPWIEDVMSKTPIDASNLVFLPFLYGTNVANSTGGELVGLDTLTTRPMIMRAVYEGIAFAHKRHFDALQESTDSFEAIRMSGGATNSEFWVQLFADVMNKEVQVISETEMGALGGAILAAKAVGLYPNLENAMNEMSTISYSKYPNVNSSRIYEEKYNKYCAILKQKEGSS